MDGEATPCRFCGTPLEHVFVDLGLSPLANAYIPLHLAGGPESFYPLRALICAECLLVQLQEVATPGEIFGDYAYFSSYSSSWLEHARRYTGAVVERFGLDGDSSVVELASNDGYLLQYFQQRGIPVLGVEPATNVARHAREQGIPTLAEFFGMWLGRALAAGTPADLVVANNVLAHVPDLNDFVGGIKLLLAEHGVATLEFPHLMRLIEGNQWDTIYHEHFSYFSFLTVRRVFAAHGLRLFDVEELPTHGGSLRIYACHEDDAERPATPAVDDLLARERAAGCDDLAMYLDYGRRAERDKQAIVAFLAALKAQGKTIVGYGAPAKGNTLLNYCGVRSDVIDYTVDRNPHKQGRLLPGTHIPIHAPEQIRATRPDVVLILPWNLRGEIMDEIGYIREWGGAFAARAPRDGEATLQVLP
jgi:SAM-dependent methyltransferase